LGVGLTTLPCKKENCWEASKKLNRILWRRPRPTLGCGAKNRRRNVRLWTFKIGTDMWFRISPCVWCEVLTAGAEDATQHNTTSMYQGHKSGMSPGRLLHLTPIWEPWNFPLTERTFTFLGCIKSYSIRKELVAHLCSGIIPTIRRPGLSPRLNDAHLHITDVTNCTSLQWRRS